MGQYFRPIVLKKNWKLAKQPVKASVLCYDFDNGAKLMEHSYVGNKFVNKVMQILANQYYGYHFVWCGDYADEVENSRGESVDLYDKAGDFIDREVEDFFTDLPREEKYTQAYNDLCDTFVEDYVEYKYLINLSKKVYVVMEKNNPDEWQVHPLPLFTCNSNGRGGGDYRLDDERVGSWAFDRIAVSNDDEAIKGLKKVDGYFEMDL